MPRRVPVSDEYLQRIREIWADNPKLSARKVHKQFVRQFGIDVVGLRKVQQVIREIRRKGGEPFVPTKWIPWLNPEESPKDAAFLLRSQRMWLELFGRTLYQHEARWGRRLRCILQDEAYPNWIALIIMWYSKAEELAFNLSEDIDTDGFDALMMFRPWASPEHWRRYELALTSDQISHIRPLVTMGQYYLLELDALICYLYSAVLDRGFFRDLDRSVVREIPDETVYGMVHEDSATLASHAIVSYEKEGRDRMLSVIHGQEPWPEPWGTEQPE